ncbi:hypothetical protein VBM87_02125 [Mycoplasma sp. 744]|uniref:hypothetical protein n=1 Tax=Mycoplasma sp. 744 TaxID=3108531 RepID=UPI002B1DFC20|nr:hypothetical protein [Mycoplasma sp. 744]MEA4115569.1 hypothetical protein [Mycoplasma sp. 744]
MNKNKFLKLASIASSAVLASTALLPLSLTFTNELDNETSAFGLQESIYYMSDDKFTDPELGNNANNKFWTTQYVAEQELQEFQTRYVHNTVSSTDKTVYDKVRFVDPTLASFTTERNRKTFETNNGWQNPLYLNNGTTWLSTNPGQPQKMRFVFNFDGKHRGQFYGNGWHTAAAVFLSKDLQFTNPIDINVVKIPKGGVGQSRFFNVADSIRWTFKSKTNPGGNDPANNLFYHANSSKNNERIFINNAEIINAYSDNIESNAKGSSSSIDLYKAGVANILIHNSYKPKKWFDSQASDPVGVLNKYLDTKSVFYGQSNGRYIRSRETPGFASKNDAYADIKASIGAVATFNIHVSHQFNNANDDNMYFVVVDFEVKQNFDNLKSNNNDYSSAGQSFIGGAFLQHKNGEDNDNRWLVASNIFHSHRKASKNLNLVITEKLSDAIKSANRNEKLPNLKIVAKNNTNQTVFEIQKNNSSYQTWARTSNTNSEYKTKASIITTASGDTNVNNLTFSIPSNINTDKKFIIKKTALQGTTNINNTNHNNLYLEWDYTDYYKIKLELDKKEWLTKGQKDTFLNEFMTSDMDQNTFMALQGASLNDYIRRINLLNQEQQKLEQAYTNVYRFLETNNNNQSINSSFPWITWKHHLLFSTSNNSSRNNIIELLTDNYALAYNQSSLNNNINTNAIKIRRESNILNNITNHTTLSAKRTQLETLYSNLTNRRAGLDGANNIANLLNELFKLNIYNKAQNSYNNNQIQQILKTYLDEFVNKVGHPNYRPFITRNDNTTTISNKLNEAQTILTNFKTKAQEKSRNYESFVNHLEPTYRNIKNSIYITGANDLSNDLWLTANRINDFNVFEKVISDYIKALKGQFTGSELNRNVIYDKNNFERSLPNIDFSNAQRINSNRSITNLNELVELMVFVANNILGQGAANAKEVQNIDSKILSEEDKKRYISGSAVYLPIKWSIGYLNGVYINGTNVSTKTEYNNYTYNNNNNNNITDNTTKVNTYLFTRIFKPFYKEMVIDVAQSYINNSKDINDTNIKTSYSNKLNALWNKIDRLDASKSESLTDGTVFVTEFNNLMKEFYNYERITKLANDTVKTFVDKFDYQNKNSVAVANVNNNGITIRTATKKDDGYHIVVGNDANAVDFLFIIKEIQKTNAAANNNGSINIKYQLRTAGSILEHFVYSTEATSNTITGFAPNSEAERRRIEELAKKIWVGYRDGLQGNITPDSANPTDVTFMYYPDSNNLDRREELSAHNVRIENIEKATIQNEDYRNGWAPVSYTITSTTVPNISIRVDADELRKTATGNQIYKFRVFNFKTEETRLNEVIDAVQLTINNNKNTLASSETQEEIKQNINNLVASHNAAVNTINLNANDDTGQLTINFTLNSTKTNATNIVSKTRSIVLSGYLTNIEQYQNNVNNQINDLTNLSSFEKQTFTNRVNSARTNDQINQILLEAQKQHYLKEVQLTLNNLNPKQRNDINAKINSANNLNNIQNELENYKSINAKMATLKTKVHSATNNTKVIEYNTSSQNKKTVYDDIINKAKDLLNSNSNDGLTNNLLDNLISNVANKNSVDYASAQLDGFKLRYEGIIKNLAYLSENEKNSLIKEIQDINLEVESRERTSAIAQIGRVNSKATTLNREKENIYNSFNNNYLNLNSAQTNDLKEKIKTLDKDNLEANVISVASELNNSMKSLKNELLNELKKLTENSSLNDINSNQNKTANKYTLADSNLKSSYDSQLRAALDIINNQNANNDTVTSALTSLQQAFNNLNGDANNSKFDQAINNLTNLSESQRNNIKQQIANINDQNQAQAIVDSAKLLNDKIKTLEDQNNTMNALLESDNYKSETAQKQQTFKNVLDNNKQLLTTLKAKTYNDSNLKTIIDNDNNSIDTALNNANSEIDTLAGLKRVALETLDKFSNLNNSEKENFKSQVNQLANNATKNQYDQIINNAFTLSKTKAKDTIDATTYLSTSEKDALKQRVESATLDFNQRRVDQAVVNAAGTAIRNDNTKKQAITAIQALNDLTQMQKNALIEEIKTSNTSESTKIKTKAENLEKAMKALKDEILKELSNLTQKQITNVNDQSAKTNPNYALAQDTKKSAYDTQLTNAINTLSTQSSTNDSHINQITTNLKSSFGALDGNNKQNEVNQSIDTLNNLTQEQRKALKDAVAKETSQTKANKIVEKAKLLNQAIANAKTQKESATNIKNQKVYTSDLINRQNELNNALNDLETSLTNAQNNLNANNEQLLTQLDNWTNDLNNKTQTTKEKMDNLDGIRNDAINQINNFINLETNEKEQFVQKLNDLEKPITEEKVKVILDKTFVKAKENAKKHIDQITSLTPEQMQEFKEQIDQTEYHNGDGAPDSNVQSVLNSVANADSSKQEANKFIDNLNNLNNNQKSALKNQVLRSDNSALETIKTTAKELDNAMQNLKNKADQIAKDLINNNATIDSTEAISNKKYTLADRDQVNAFDNAYNETKAILNINTGDNDTKEQVEQLLQTLEQTYNALNGKNNQNQAKEELNNLDNLSSEQNEQITKEIEKITSKDALDNYLNEVKALNANIKNLNDSINKAKQQKETDIYKNDTTENNTKFDQALSSAENKLNEFKTKDLTSVDLSELNKEITNEKSKIDLATAQLDGLREKLRKLIKEADHLSENDKSNLNTKIENLNNNATQEEIQVLLNEALELAKTNAKNKVDQQTLLSPNEKANFKDQIEKATLADLNNFKLDKNINEIIINVEAEERLKEAVLTQIKNKQNLNDNQKATLEFRLKNTDKKDLSALSKEIRDLDNAMKALKEKVVEELKVLTNDPNATFDSQQEKEADKFKYATREQQNTYLTQLTAAQALLAKEGEDFDLDAVNDLLTQLTNAFDNLKGEENKTAYDQSISQLDQFSETQKEAIKEAIENSNNDEEANNIVTKAQSINNLINDLKTKVNQEDTIKASNLYSGESQTNKNNYDNGLTNAKDLIKEFETLTFSTPVLTNLTTEKQKLTNANNQLNNAQNNLDGARKLLLDAVDQLSNLTTEEKIAFKEKINQFDKNLSSEQENQFKNEVLEETKANTKAAIDQLINLSQDEKDKYKSQIDSAQLNENPWDKAVNDLLNQAKADNVAKVDLKTLVENTQNLNEAQKAALRNEITLTTAENSQVLKEKIALLDEAMKEYKDIQAINQNDIRYSQADENPKTHYDNLLTQKTLDVDKTNGANLDLQQVKDKINALNEALEALNGQERVNAAKQNALDRIQNEYTSLTDAQKAQAIQNINNANTLENINNADNLNKVINGETNTLKNYLNNNDTFKAQNDYSAANNDAKVAYDAQITRAQELLTQLEQANNADLLNKDLINQQNQAINNAINNLDGQNNLNAAKEEAIEAIKNAQNLNYAQKENLINQVNNASNMSEVEKIKTLTSELDQAMNDLKTTVDQNGNLDQNKDYLNASSEVKQAFEDTNNVTNNLLDKTQGANIIDIDAIKKLNQDLKDKTDKLDGNENLKVKQDQAKEIINQLTNLNNAQKEALKTKIDNALLIADVDKTTNETNTLDQAMKKLADTKEAIEKELAKETNDSYKAASEKTKNQYNQIKDQIDKVLDKTNGLATNLEDITKLEKDIIDAKEQLDGDQNYQYKFDKTENQINNSNNLTQTHKNELLKELEKITIPTDLNNQEQIDEFKNTINNLNDKKDLIENLNQNNELTAKQKEDLIKDLLDLNNNDKDNNANNLNNFADTIKNVNAKKDLYDAVNKLEDSALKNKLDDIINQLDPKDKNFNDLKSKVDKELTLINDIVNNNNLTKEEKDNLIKQITDLKLNDDNFDQTISNIKETLDKINELNQNNNLSDKAKEILKDKLINSDKNSSNFDQLLNNYEQLKELSQAINQDNNLTDEQKDKLLTNVSKVKLDDANFNKLKENIKKKKEALDLKDTTDKKANEALKSKVQDLDINNATFDEQLNDLTQRFDKVKEIKENSELNNSTKEKLIDQIVQSNKALNEIDKQIDAIRNIQNNSALSEKTKEQLIEEILAQQNYDTVKAKIEKIKELQNSLTDLNNAYEEAKEKVNNKTHQEYQNNKDKTQNILDQAKDKTLEEIEQQIKNNNQLRDDIESGKASNNITQLIVASTLVALTLGIVLIFPAIRKKIAHK